LIGSILEGLNDKQREAVTSALGNTLLLAGAGSGKTRVLVSRIAWLIAEQHIAPEAILAVTFTNKAANEMKTRLHSLLHAAGSGVWVGTFHGFCHRLLRRHYERAKLPLQFHILDSDDQARLIKRVIADLNLDPEKWPVKQAQAFINARKEEGLRAGHCNPGHYAPTRTWIAVYRAYEQASEQAGVIDFAEILLRSQELFRDNPDLLAHYQHRFQAILVDEFQDTNSLQYAFIRNLAGGGAAVMVVGDDDQSIYGWRGAKVENIFQFSQDFHHTEVIRLEQNYRSTATILQAANHLIENNSERMGKELWTAGEAGEKIALYKAYNDMDEARFVSEGLNQAMAQGINLDEVAILYRSNAQSRVFEDALLRAQIAYCIHGGMRFFERAEVKDALAYLRLLANPKDDTAFLRVVNFPPRGIGDKSLEVLRQQANEEAKSLWEQAKTLPPTVLPARATTAILGFTRLIDDIRAEVQDLDLEEQITRVIRLSGLHDHFSKLKGEEAESRLDNLQELVNAAKQFRLEEGFLEELPPLVAFLAHATLNAGETENNTEQNPVHLMTLHSAKGLEFKWVFLVGLEEGVFPSRLSLEDPSRLEEERRLCYVGLTRAKEKLHLSYAEVRRQYGREEMHRPSRFLRELPKDLLQEVGVRRATAYQRPSFQSAAPLPVSAAEQLGLRLGQRVMHATFGEGILMAVEGQGAHARAQVNFEAGSKWLVLAYAKLQPLT